MEASGALIWAAGIAFVFLGGLGGLALMIRSRQMHLWLGSYVADAWKSPQRTDSGPIHLFVCVTDHFEPVGGGVPEQQQRSRMEHWVSRYADLALRHRDFDGRPHQHTFFYPAEEYREEFLDQLSGLCGRGVGDVEVHLHHDGDTPDNLRSTLVEYTRILHERHGFLERDSESGLITYAFIHGNWALNNSRPDGRWCGVDDETSILLETGCYADMTFPSAPDATQTSTINRIYYASPGGRKSHDGGIEAHFGRPGPNNALLMVQGPLCLNWKSRKLGIVPRIENGELSGDLPPSADRVDQWVRRAVRIAGQPNWRFIKLHTHGANERNLEACLGPAREEMLSHLEARYNDGRRFRLHYVTARQLVAVIHAAEQGAGSPPDFD